MRSDNKPEDNQQSVIKIKKDYLKTEQKGNNETKCEKSKIGKKGEKGDVGQMNKTEINELKQGIIGWVILNLNQNI